MTAYERLREACGIIRDLEHTAALLDWDQQTFMPVNAEPDRVAQLTTLAGVIHEKQTDPGFARLLDQTEAECRDFPPDSVQACLIRRLRRDFEKQSKVPAALVKQLAEAAAKAHGAWANAREKAQFSLFAPHLERLLDLRRQYAALFAPYESIYDPLLDNFEEGFTAKQLDILFANLRRKLVPLLRRIIDSQPPAECPKAVYGEKEQLAFTDEVLHAVGYDFTRGRQDQSAHPFTTGFGLNDVRITTRIFPEMPLSALLSSIHECGHALYEQGISRELDRTPLADGASFGFHESQSRLWENLVGRSRAFWEYCFPVFRKYFPEQLKDASAEQIWRAVNHVEATLIRTESDEVTYNLHIMLRYEMEKELLNGTLAVKDAPAAWNAKSMELLGVEPANDAEGILQDIHWSMGEFGYFPTYAIGNLLAAQTWCAAEKQVPDLEEEIAKGNFRPLLDFLRRKVHVLGARFTPAETLRRSLDATEIVPDHFIRLLEKKYSQICGF